jgi:hypothetical protein
MFRKRASRGQASSHGLEADKPTGGGVWPTVDLAYTERLNGILKRACGTDNMMVLGSLVTELHEISGTSFLDRDRSPWEWLAAWASNAAVPDLVRIRIAFFSLLWNENIRQRAYAWGLALGYPTDDQVSTIENGAFDACAYLDPDLFVAQSDNVRSFQGELAARLSRPIDQSRWKQ